MSDTIEPATWIPTTPPTIAITRAADLDGAPDVAFELGRAPDGLMLAMHVRRAVDVRSPVMHALRLMVTSPVPRELAGALDALERATRGHSVNLGVQRVDRRAYYETAEPAPAHLGATLLARLLGARSPMILPEDARASSASSSPERFESTMACAMADAGTAQLADVPEAPRFGSDQRLWIEIGNGTRALVAPGATGDAMASLARARPLVLESLLGVRSARFHARRRGMSSGTLEGALADPRAYRQALDVADRLSWSVSRTDAMQLVAELARTVDRDFHMNGRVHADLKPANVVLEATGITAFDGIGVPVGQVAAGMTEGWAAPEQVFVRPLSPATDVYALGLMAVSALSAAVYGEEHALVVPAFGDGRRRLRMMKDPEIWVDPKAVGLPLEGRVAWRELLMSCLASDPARRPVRGADLAGRIDQLLSRWELPGRLAIACGPGRPEQMLGTGEPIWLLTDSR